VKICSVIQIKLKVCFKKVSMIINLLTERIRAISRANNFQCFTYKMAVITSWHRQETKLRHRHVYNAQERLFVIQNKTKPLHLRNLLDLISNNSPAEVMLQSSKFLITPKRIGRLQYSYRHRISISEVCSMLSKLGQHATTSRFGFT